MSQELVADRSESGGVKPIVVLGLCFALTLALVAFGSGLSRSTPRQQARSGPQINWDAPLFDGVRVSSSEALELTDIPAFVPAGLGQHAIVYVDNPQHFPPTKRDVVFVYHHQRYGSFYVLEQPRKRSQADLEALLTHADDSEANARIELVKVGGHRCVLIAGTTAVGIEWLTDDLDVVVVGPAASFAIDSAKEIAALLVG